MGFDPPAIAELIDRLEACGSFGDAAALRRVVAEPTDVEVEEFERDMVASPADQRRAWIRAALAEFRRARGMTQRLDSDVPLAPHLDRYLVAAALRRLRAENERLTAEPTEAEVEAVADVVFRAYGVGRSVARAAIDAFLRHREETRS